MEISDGKQSLFVPGLPVASSLMLLPAAQLLVLMSRPWVASQLPGQILLPLQDGMTERQGVDGRPSALQHSC